jgi:hypothetical protein
LQNLNLSQERLNVGVEVIVRHFKDAMAEKVYGSRNGVGRES